MLEVFRPVVRQLDETYDAVRISLGLMTDAQLGWAPNHGLDTAAQIACHIAIGNAAYASMIGPEYDFRAWRGAKPDTSRDLVRSRLDESQQVAKRTLDGVAADDLGRSRADDWRPNCDEQVIEGPLDALWFAQQMVRHTAYHLGQINLYLRILEGPSSQP